MKRNPFSANEETLRRLLRARRNELGLRQQDLAAKLGVHQSFVSKYESGDRLLTFTETINVCEALMLDPHGLLTTYLEYDGR